MSTEEPDIGDAFLVALTRISGILLGVFLSLSLSVIIFPRSASHQVGPPARHASLQLSQPCTARCQA